jgi:hypothetical protein
MHLYRIFLSGQLGFLIGKVLLSYMVDSLVVILKIEKTKCCFLMQNYLPETLVLVMSLLCLPCLLFSYAIIYKERSKYWIVYVMAQLFYAFGSIVYYLSILISATPAYNYGIKDKWIDCMHLTLNLLLPMLTLLLYCHKTKIKR